MSQKIFVLDLEQSSRRKISEMAAQIAEMIINDVIPTHRYHTIGITFVYFNVEAAEFQMRKMLSLLLEDINSMLKHKYSMPHLYHYQVVLDLEKVPDNFDLSQEPFSFYDCTLKIDRP